MVLPRDGAGGQANQTGRSPLCAPGFFGPFPSAMVHAPRTRTRLEINCLAGLARGSLTPFADLHSPRAKQIPL